MKIFNIYQLFTLFIAVVLVSSCVQDDQFDVPDGTIQDQDGAIEGTQITISALRDLLVQEQNNNQNDILDLGETDTYIVGYVISSDEGGNFFEELILQDQAENPTAGVKGQRTRRFTDSA